MTDQDNDQTILKLMYAMVDFIDTAPDQSAETDMQLQIASRQLAQHIASLGIDMTLTSLYMLLLGAKQQAIAQTGLLSAEPDGRLLAIVAYMARPLLRGEVD